MNRTGRWIILGVALLLVAVLGFRQVGELNDPRIEIFLADRDLASGSEMTEEDLRRSVLRRSRVPGDAILEKERIVGQVLQRNKPSGVIFRAPDFRAPPPSGPSLAEAVPKGRVLLSATPSNMGEVGQFANALHFGDRFDILAGDYSIGAARIVARDVFFTAWMEPPAEEEDGDGADLGFVTRMLEQAVPAASQGAPAGDYPMLLAVHPGHVVPLTTAQARREPLYFVLHGRTEVEEGELLSIGSVRPISVDLISGRNRQLLQVEP